MHTNLNTEMVENYHNQGLMSDGAYYQLNGKNAQENYADQVNKRNKAWKEQLLDNSGEDDYSNVHITSEVKIKK